MRKKTLSIVAALFMCACGAWAQTAGAGSITVLPTDVMSKQSYMLVSPRGTLYFDANVKATSLTSNCSGPESPTKDVTVTAEEEKGQFLLFPAENYEHGYYVYSVAASKFIKQDGVRAALVDEPNVVYIWAHGATGTGTQAYSNASFEKSDYGFTIGSAYRTTGQYNTINVCCWDASNRDYRWCNTNNLDDGNMYAIVEAEEVDQDVWKAAYDKIYNVGYTVNIEGAEAGAIVVDEETYGDNATFSHALLTADDIKVTPVEGYLATVSISDEHIITVTYTEKTFKPTDAYTLFAQKSQRGYLASWTQQTTYVSLAGVELSGYETRHPALNADGVAINWELDEVAAGKVTFKNINNGLYLVKDGSKAKWSETPMEFTFAKESDGSYHFQASNNQYLIAACGYQENEGAAIFGSHEEASDFVVTMVDRDTENPDIDADLAAAKADFEKYIEEVVAPILEEMEDISEDLYTDEFNNACYELSAKMYDYYDFVKYEYIPLASVAAYETAKQELSALIENYKKTKPNIPGEASEAEKAFKAAYNELKALVDQYVAGYDEETYECTFKEEGLSDDAKNELIEDYLTIIGYAEDGVSYPESDEAFATATGILQEALANLQAALDATPAAPVFPAAGDYYVYIKNYDTGRNPYLYNNVDEATGYTLQAANLDNANNGYIWHVTSDGEGKITSIVSGTGKGVGVNGGSKPVLSELDYEDAGNGYYYIGNSVLGGWKWLNASKGAQNNGKGTSTVTNYSKENASKWTFETVNMEGLTAYNVVVEGCAEGLAVLNGEYAGNNGFFLTASAEGVEAKTIENYNTFVSTVGNTITVTYTPGETLIAARQDAIVAALAKVGQLGYPKADADAVTALNNYTVTTDNYAASTTLLANLYACTDVVMPEVGKSYRVAFRKSNDSLQYINGDATSATADDATVLTLAASETGNEFAYTLAGADGSYLTNKGVKSDATTVRAASINLKFGQLSASQYVTLDASKYYGAFALYTEKRYDSNDLGCLVMGESANSFDGANAPFFNGSYTSAIVLEEVENTPEVDPAIAEAKEALKNYLENEVAEAIADFDFDAENSYELMNAYTELSVAATLMSQGKNTDYTDFVTAEDYTNALNDLKEFVKAFEDAKSQQPEVDPEALAAAKAAYDAAVAQYTNLIMSYYNLTSTNTGVHDAMKKLNSTLEGVWLTGDHTIEEYNAATTAINNALEEARLEFANADPEFADAMAELNEIIAKANEIAKEYGHVAPSGTAASDSLNDLVSKAHGYTSYKLNLPTSVEEAQAAVSTMKDFIKAFYESCTIQILVNAINENSDNTLNKVDEIKAGILKTYSLDEDAQK